MAAAAVAVTTTVTTKKDDLSGRQSAEAEALERHTVFSTRVRAEALEQQKAEARTSGRDMSHLEMRPLKTNKSNCNWSSKSKSMSKGESNNNSNRNGNGDGNGNGHGNGNGIEVQRLHDP